MVARPEMAVPEAAATVVAAVALAGTVVATKAEAARESVVTVVTVVAMATVVGVAALAGGGLPRRYPASGTWSGRQGVRTYRSRTHNTHRLREQRRSTEAPQRPPAACSHLAWALPSL